MRTNRKTSGLAISVILLTLSAHTAYAQRDSIEAEILAAGEAWLAALDRRDAQAMDQMETEDFVFVQDGLLVNKPEQIAMLRSTQVPSPATPTRSVKVNSLSLEGDVAVMTGTRTVGMGGISIDAVFTEVWARANEEWLIKAAHYSTGGLPANASPQAGNTAEESVASE